MSKLTASRVPNAAPGCDRFSDDQTERSDEPLNFAFDSSRCHMSSLRKGEMQVLGASSSYCSSVPQQVHRAVGRE
ncbi:hypothetical protein AB3X94_37680 [Paraburkholderia sp. BR10923]|uniref:hypothetical protein n=1 Tax=Paraburkholderia sp. BR10923 TaxID=3236992 RepID=UPI0034CEF5DB